MLHPENRRKIDDSGTANDLKESTLTNVGSVPYEEVTFRKDGRTWSSYHISQLIPSVIKTIEENGSKVVKFSQKKRFWRSSIQTGGHFRSEFSLKY